MSALADDRGPAGARVVPRCFPSGAAPPPEPHTGGLLALALGHGHLHSGLSDRCAEGVAGLLPAMVCGEESAVMVFENERRRAPADLFVDSRATLERIAREEEQHEQALRAVAAGLPVASHDAATRRQARRFFLTLHTHDIGTHFSRIAWLDSGVCIILSSLTRRTLPIARARPLQFALDAIVRDEARHVAFSRAYAGHLNVDWRDDQESFARVRGGLVDLLAPCAGAFEQLGVDPDALFTRLKNRAALKGPS